MTNRQQRLLLNGRTSKWTNILARVPQGSALGSLLFLIYINDLPDGLKSIRKVFADDTSLYSKINDIDTSNIDINNDLVKISRWAYQWKMLFDPDINKQAAKVYFLRYIFFSEVYFASTDCFQCRLLFAKSTWVLYWIASLVSMTMLTKK